MNEDFVSFELAVKLKDKGYPQDELCRYNEDGNMYLDDIPNAGYCAPTISQALKWLRDERKVFIEISITTSGYYPTVYSNIDLTLANKTTYYQEYIGATHEDYNKCVLEAIEYTLDNLI